MNEKFHERFGIEINLVEAKCRFIVRIENRIFQYGDNHGLAQSLVANALGQHLIYGKKMSQYVENDFDRCLQVVEAIYKARSSNSAAQQTITKEISEILSDSECDLGIRWKDGSFINAGAALLDKTLVDDQLRWLSSPKFESVLNPFQKGYRHFYESAKRPELLSDVVTDMYESVEALAKIFTGRGEKDLSANAELFLLKIDASPKYKNILKSYIEYANDFRHAVKNVQTRSSLKKSEVESFIYLTGLFIRLAQQSDKEVA